MPSGGHNRKPTRIKELAGTLKPERVLKDEYTPTLMVSVPPPPEHYSEKVKQTWNKVANELLDNGILYNIDMDLLENYCDSFDLQLRLLADVNKSGTTIENDKGNVIANPSLVQYIAVTKLMLVIGANLGIGPANRTKIGGSKKATEDAFEKLLRKKPV